MKKLIIYKYFKYIIFALATMFIILLISYISSQSIRRRISNSLGIKIPIYAMIECEDSHGGFHGDGDTLAKVPLYGKGEEKVIIEIKDKWKLILIMMWIYLKEILLISPWHCTIWI